MNVEINIVLSDPPSKSYLDELTATALSCTNAQKSVRVESAASDHRYFVTVSFAMKTAAQYKVVDGIDRAFKPAAWNCKGYQDMSIRFP